MPDAEVHQEIFYRYTAIRLPEMGGKVSQYFMAVVPEVLSITKSEIQDLPDLAIAYPGLQPRDLFHLAVMRRHGLSRIATADRGFDGIAGITRVALESF